MFFVALLLLSVGYDLVYAGVKGQGFQINKQSVWQHPWLPFAAAFSNTAGIISQGGKKASVRNASATPTETIDWTGASTPPAGSGSSTPDQVTNVPPGYVQASPVQGT